MITFKPSGIEGYPCHDCKSIYCNHVNRKPCINCAVHQHPDTIVIHINNRIICHRCVQEIISSTNGGVFYYPPPNSAVANYRFACQVCSNVYSSYKSLMDHYKSVHGEE